MRYPFFVMGLRFRLYVRYIDVRKTGNMVRRHISPSKNSPFFYNLLSLCTPILSSNSTRKDHMNIFVWFSLFYIQSVCYNERSYYERMLQQTIFINKVRMLQRTIGRRSTRVSGLSALIRASVIIRVIVCKVRLSVYFSFLLICALSSEVFLIILLYNFSHEPAN